MKKKCRGNHELAANVTGREEGSASWGCFVTSSKESRKDGAVLLGPKENNWGKELVVVFFLF